MKKVKWIVLLLICVVLAFFCAKRWNVWFGNPTEPHYISLHIPNRIQLTFGNDGEFSRNISWQCGDSLQTSNLFLTKNTSVDTVSIIAEGRVLHTIGGTTVSYHAKMKDLSAGVYSYSVSTGNQQSAWHPFEVKNDTDKFSFVYLGDIQDTINGKAGDFLANVYKQEKEAAFWILGGDVIERPQDRYWNEYFSAMDSIAQTMPIIAAPGNHEYLKTFPRKLEERFVCTFSYLLDSSYEGHAVFNTTYGNMAIITLDSNHNFWTLSSQRNWLKKALAASQNVKWKIVVLHHPIHSISGKMNNLQIKIAFNSLLKQYGVDLVLQGHEHSYARMISRKNDDFATPVYVVGNSAYKNYPPYRNENYDRFGSQMRFYQTINVNGDSLRLKTYAENETLFDDILLIKASHKTSIFDLSTGIPEQAVKFK